MVTQRSNGGFRSSEEAFGEFLRRHEPDFDAFCRENGRFEPMLRVLYSLQLGASERAWAASDDRSMARAGTNHNAHARPDINQLFVQLHLGPRLAFQKVVGFRQTTVVVEPGRRGNLRNMNGGW